ncbi:ABC transporter ATP-binding protein [Paracoccus sp. IB05]|uniref:ABC transporter ATP-binding protein n=1 Tax=Paracoccus sp. IB05 TaxID=2779367 RepID=UPI0018E876E0|nr:ABC transporter ATP-binding protein [Paracoccus sp. IB05]MBJ2151597.1 ABC transporter ATP-binding protein [Paracoccus sp. IB05]
MALLEIRDISKSFGGIRALDQITFSVEEGEIFGLMGANGAGKTTLFAVIAGQIRPGSGQVLLRGECITGLRPDRICRRGISRTFQIVRPFGGVTALENATISALYGSDSPPSRKGATEAAAVALEAVGLGAQKDRPASELTLSGQKRLEIARALSTGAGAILLDEVMAGLTPPEVDEMIATLRGLRHDRKLTFILVEHVMSALMTLSDRVLAMDRGRMVALGVPDEISRNKDVLKAYFG